MSQIKLSSFLLLLVLGLCFSSCGERIKGNGNVTEVEHELADFDEIDIAGMFEVELIKGNPKAVMLTDENLHEHISIVVEDGELKVHSNHKYLDGEEMLLQIYYRDLNELAISGASQIRSPDVFKGDVFELDVSGACELDLDVRLDELVLDLSGGSEITLRGRADNVEIDISGAAEINAAELIADHVSIDVAGAGEVEIEANKTLNVEVAGAGEVRYLGDPEISQNITGAGEVKKLNQKDEI